MTPDKYFLEKGQNFKKKYYLIHLPRAGPEPFKKRFLSIIISKGLKTIPFQILLRY